VVFPLDLPLVCSLLEGESKGGNSALAGIGHIQPYHRLNLPLAALFTLSGDPDDDDFEYLAVYRPFTIAKAESTFRRRADDGDPSKPF
jgi:hypothetical protein